MGLHPIPAGLRWGPLDAAHPPLLPCPHPHLAFQLMSTWRAEWGRAFAQPHIRTLHFPWGWELEDSPPGPVVLGLGSPSEGASLVTFP